MDDILAAAAKSEDGLSGEDLNRFNLKMAELKFNAEQAKSAGGVGFLREVARGVNPLAEFSDGMSDLDAKSGATGFVNPNRRPMTLGEAFVKSPAMREWIEANTDAAGNVRKGVKSPEVALHAALQEGARYLTTEDQDDPSLPPMLKGKNTKNLVFGAPVGSTGRDSLFSPTRRLPMVDQVPTRRRPRDAGYLHQRASRELGHVGVPAAHLEDQQR